MLDLKSKFNLDTFVDAVKYAYNQGYFKVSDKYNYGCMGIHCETCGVTQNGFYCFDSEADCWEGTVEEYIAYYGVDNICKDIATTIVNFIEDSSFPEEAECYLIDMLNLCNEQDNSNQFEDVILELISKANEKIKLEELEDLEC